MREFLAVFGSLVALAFPAKAQQLSKALVCTFSAGTFSTFSGDWSVRPSNDKLELTYAAIDTGAFKAQLIGNAGAATVFFRQGDHSLHFLEITAAGNQTLTTVYWREKKGQSFPAAHSRQMSLFNMPTVSHLRGYCSPRF